MNHVFLRGESEAMRNVRARLAQAVRWRCPVLILGETGTGKSLAAHLLARARSDRARSVYGVDFETRRPRRAEIVEDLDELSPVATRRLCAWLDAYPNCIATAETIPAGQTLQHRLVGAVIRLPPLRERLDDLDLLCAWFGGLATEPMRRHAWPGNVRELRNVVRSGRGVNTTSVGGASLREAEAAHIDRILKSVGWNKTRAAELLGIQRSTVYQKIKEHDLRPPE